MKLNSIVHLMPNFVPLIPDYVDDEILLIDEILIDEIFIKSAVGKEFEMSRKISETGSLCEILKNGIMNFIFYEQG